MYFQPLGCFLAWLPRQGGLSSLWAASWRGFHVKDVFPAFGLLLGLASKRRMYFQPLGCFLAWLPRQGCIFSFSKLPLDFRVKDVFPAIGLLLGLASTSRIYFQLLGCFLAWLPRQGCISSLWAVSWHGFHVKEATSWRGFHVKDVFPAFGLLLGVASTSRMYFQPLSCFLALIPGQGCISNFSKLLLDFRVEDVFPAFGLLLGLASKPRMYFKPLGCFLAS
ncbi:hypothetical protein Dimus_017849 [Dionaea muscipula]